MVIRPQGFATSLGLFQPKNNLFIIFYLKYEASENNAFNVVKYLAERVNNINQVNSSNETALYSGGYFCINLQIRTV